MKLLFFCLLPTLLFSTMLHGILLNSITNKPIINAKIFNLRHQSFSDSHGFFSIDINSSTTYIKAYGYWPYKLILNKTSKYFLLPIHIKALYLSFWSESLKSSRFKYILKLKKEGKINAIVIDIKNSMGYTSYHVKCKLANQLHSYKYKMIKNITKFMNIMKKNHIYTIARIDVFKDNLFASKYPQFVLHGTTSWINPYKKKSYFHTLCIAKNAASHGFDEINFDYIRFPTNLNKGYTSKNRIKAILKFLQDASHALRPYGVFTSVDVFGNVLWVHNGSNIGQTILSLKKYVDYLDPMLYPSGFSSGYFMLKNPASHPYKVVYKSLKHMQRAIKSIRVHPWLQAFKDYSIKKIFYGKKQIQAQIKACTDANCTNWMLWNSSSRYNSNYFITRD